MNLLEKIIGDNFKFIVAIAIILILVHYDIITWDKVISWIDIILASATSLTL